MTPWAGLLLAAVSLWALQALVFGQAPGASAHRAPFIALWLLGIAIAIACSRRRPDTQSP